MEITETKYSTIMREKNIPWRMMLKRNFLVFISLTVSRMKLMSFTKKKSDSKTFWQNQIKNTLYYAQHTIYTSKEHGFLRFVYYLPAIHGIYYIILKTNEYEKHLHSYRAFLLNDETRVVSLNEPNVEKIISFLTSTSPLLLENCISVYPSIC